MVELKRKYTLLDSFSFAFRGIFRAIKKERNFRIHLVLATTAISLGFYFKLSHFEWLALVLTIGMVISAEIFNTAIESLADLIRARLDLDYYETYWVRNFSAGAVLVTAITALTTGIIIFLPKFF